MRPVRLLPRKAARARGWENRLAEVERGASAIPGVRLADALGPEVIARRKAAAPRLASRSR